MQGQGISRGIGLMASSETNALLRKGRTKAERATLSRSEIEKGPRLHAIRSESIPLPGLETRICELPGHVGTNQLQAVHQ